MFLTMGFFFFHLWKIIIVRSLLRGEMIYATGRFGLSWLNYKYLLSMFFSLLLFFFSSAFEKTSAIFQLSIHPGILEIFFFFNATKFCDINNHYFQANARDH